MTAQRGRGRPALFNAAARAAYLKARTEGANQQEAAALVGIAAKTVRNARRDPAFRDADDTAAAEGKTKRLAHGESRYKHAGCRCGICTKEATEARRSRRVRAADGRKGVSDEGPVAPVVAMPRADQGSSEAFPLARAS